MAIAVQHEGCLVNAVNDPINWDLAHSAAKAGESCEEIMDSDDVTNGLVGRNCSWPPSEGWNADAALHIVTFASSKDGFMGTHWCEFVHWPIIGHRYHQCILSNTVRLQRR
tara:strand:+ start:701 stop:1033 length:333 start_codon:yes stop_codon:yes gene_type:complete